MSKACLEDLWVPGRPRVEDEAKQLGRPGMGEKEGECTWIPPGPS